MLHLALNRDPGFPLRVLCLGAHSDDIEIGCGGMLLKLQKEYPNLAVHWIVLGADQPERATEARASAEALLRNVKEKEIVIQGFRDSFFPYSGVEIKEYCDTLKRISPDLILTHYGNDLHQDHRLVAELTWNLFRDHLVLEYEIPKYDGDLGRPNVFASLDKSACEAKISHILEHFASQAGKHWFTAETFWATLRLRGIESKAPGGYAEAFHCRKLVL